MKNVPKFTWLLATIAIFLAGNLIFTACGKDKTLSGSMEPTEPSFSKTFTVTDENKNSAVVTVFGANEARINEFQASQFELSIRYSPRPNIMISEPQQEEKVQIFQDWNDANTTTILVSSFSLPSNATGFRVDLKPEFKNSIERWDNTNYAYLADGVNGAVALYEAESCSQENLVLDLDKKQSCDNWFWQDLANSTLTTQGDEWGFYTGNSSYCIWRFRYKFENSCRGRLKSVEWEWIL